MDQKRQHYEAIINKALTASTDNRGAKIAQAEEYIQMYIAVLGIERYKQDVMAAKTKADMHLYFGMSQNQELKDLWAETKKAAGMRVEKDASADLMAAMRANTAKAAQKNDCIEAKYEICYHKGSFMVIAIQKSATKGREKPARGYHIEVSQKTAPVFYQYCIENVQPA